MQQRFAPVALLILLVVMIAGGALYQVDETEQVIITQFGKPVRRPITTPGLHVKLPFMQTVRRFDKRVLEWDGLPDQMPTLDKRFILVDTTARWRIVDPLLFLQAVGDEPTAQSRLDGLINSAVRDMVSGHQLLQDDRSRRNRPDGKNIRYTFVACPKGLRARKEEYNGLRSSALCQPMRPPLPSCPRSCSSPSVF
jgi:membrane protease subunit HflC